MAELPDGLDQVAVELALEGDVAVSLTPDELEYCWRELESENKAAGDIAEILGVSRRAVVRWRGGMGVSARPGKRSTLASVRQGEPTPPAPAAMPDLIEAGKRSRVNRTRAIAERVERDLATLGALLIEEEERAKALQEVRELEARLAAAKERLRPATAGHQKKRGGLRSALPQHRPQSGARMGNCQWSPSARPWRCLEPPHRAVPRSASERIKSQTE